MQEDGTGKGLEDEEEKKFRQAQTNHIGMMFAAMKRISMNKQTSMRGETERKKTLPMGE